MKLFELDTIAVHLRKINCKHLNGDWKPVVPESLETKATWLLCGLPHWQQIPWTLQVKWHSLHHLQNIHCDLLCFLSMMSTKKKSQVSVLPFVLRNWPLCLDCGPPLWSSHAVPEFYPSYHLSCSSSADGPRAARSSLQTLQTWPCRVQLIVLYRAGWQRKRPQLSEDSLPARIYQQTITRNDNVEHKSDIFLT